MNWTKQHIENYIHNIQWIARMPNKIWEAFQRNAGRESLNHELHIHKIESYDKFTKSFFAWNATDEGGEFWKSVNEEKFEYLD